MPRCAKCGGGLLRARRNIIEKLIYSTVYRCKTCDLRTGITRAYTLYFSPVCHCPNCGNERVRTRSKPDKIDKLLKTPMSLVQRMLGGTLYHCLYCRIQFYDVRKLSSVEANTAKVADWSSRTSTCRQEKPGPQKSGGPPQCACGAKSNRNQLGGIRPISVCVVPSARPALAVLRDRERKFAGGRIIRKQTRACVWRDSQDLELLPPGTRWNALEIWAVPIIDPWE